MVFFFVSTNYLYIFLYNNHGDNMRLKNKKKSHFYIIFILIILLIIIYVVKIVFKIKTIPTILINDINHHISADYMMKDIVTKAVAYHLPSSNGYDKINFNIAEPKVYIYNTHDTEKYSNGSGVYDAAKVFEQKLESLGISTLVEDEKVSPYLSQYTDTFTGAYLISRGYFFKVLNTYPDIDLIIDLHRDSLKREYTYTTIDGKNYAKVLFVQGVRYDKYKENMSLAKKICDKLDEKYYGISKGIMLKEQPYQHDSYNQDLSIHALLLELGSNTNTFEEVVNTIDVLVPIIEETLYEKESY